MARETEGSAAAGGASRVAAGILLSRLAGLARDAAIAFYFGVGPHADVFRTALRGPNLLQNLLGEQSLSASFIPVYSRLLAEGKEREAGRLAGGVFCQLLSAASLLALVGILFARPIVGVLAPGFLGDAARVAAGEAAADRFELAVGAVRLLFPMTGLLVLSAWCLGILNSHRRFFLPYAAPVLWNGAVLTALFAAGGWGAPPGATWLDRLLTAACLGALSGGFVQFAVQLPAVARLLRGFRLSLSRETPGLREVVGNFAPLVAARGVLQLSAYLDLLLASLLTAGAVAGLSWAQALYLLPVSLFGMSVAAAELPELARQSGAERRDRMPARLTQALRRTAFLTVPAAVGYLALGRLFVQALFQRGSFGPADTWLVYLVLCGYSAGLVAANGSRQLANAFYALGEARTPARIAVARVTVSAALGAPLMFLLDRLTVAGVVGLAADGTGLRLGALGLALGAGTAAWLELVLLRRRLRAALPRFALPLRPVGRMLACAAAAVLPAALLWRALALPAWAATPLAGGLYAGTYLLTSRAMGIPEARSWTAQWRRGSRTR